MGDPFARGLVALDYVKTGCRPYDIAVTAGSDWLRIGALCWLPTNRSGDGHFDAQQ
jgi:hypothetical protein